MYPNYYQFSDTKLRKNHNIINILPCNFPLKSKQRKKVQQIQTFIHFLNAISAISLQYKILNQEL